MKFTNSIGVKVEYKPFYQTCLKLWRIARYENGQLETVLEHKEFLTKESCLKAIDKPIDYISY